MLLLVPVVGVRQEMQNGDQGIPARIAVTLVER
jgi:hypothetical protein